MSNNLSPNGATRSILAKSLTTISNLTETLDQLLVEEKATLSTLEELQQQVKETEKKYERLKELIDATRVSKGKMETVAHDLRCLLSPVKTLPTEILLKIFAETIEQADMERQAIASSWGYPVPDRTPLLLAQVCSRWRQIFLLNPSLWKHIEFRPVKIDHTPAEVPPDFFHHAKHGASSRLSLFIPYWDESIHKQLLQALKTCPVSPNSLEIDMTEDPEGDWDIKAIGSQEVTVYRGNAFRTSSYITPLLRGAHKVTLGGNPPAWGPIPWVALRVLIISEFSDVDRFFGPGISFGRVDLSQILDSAPFLENLQLTFEVEETDLAWDTNISASHAHLKSLTIHLHHFAGGKGLFGVNLDLPALQTIKFLSIYCRMASAEDLNFICQLKTPTKLVLPEMKNHEWQMATGLLRWLPNIQRLEMVGKNANTLLDVARAAYLHLPPLVVPLVSQALTTLHIENTDIVGETLLGFLRGKLQHRLAGTEGVSAIECIEMYNTPGVTLIDWEKIQALLKDGRVANSTHSTAE